MKKVYSNISLAIAGLLALSSCKKVLEKQDLGNFTAEQIYNDSTTTTLSLNYIYGQNQPGWFGSTGGSVSGSLNGLTEEQYSDNAFVKGTVNIETVTDIATTNAVSTNYGKIRTLNMFIRDVNAGTMSLPMKRRFNAQAYFWRAYRYFELAKLYGGVPLVTTPLEAVGDEAKEAALVPRSNAAATFALIKSDLDSCIKYLPGKWPSSSDYGRITSGAAAAFLGRVLVTYASPQFNTTSDVNRWQEAYDVNTKAVALLTANGFGLYNKWDYTMWTNERNSEEVWVTGYNTLTVDLTQNNTTYPTNTLPKSTGAAGGSNQPTWDIAMAFPMVDGKPATGTGASVKYPFSMQLFYKNRDPRFYQTIAYNGCNWPLLGNNNYRLWTYFFFNDKSKPTTTATTESGGATVSGLYLRKGIDPTFTLSNIANAGTDWPEIRYAEVLLNQAEAAAELNKLGTSQEGYANIVALRRRAGIEAGSDGLYGLTAGMTKEQLVDAVMYERQIELAFEGKRYWDLRRRKLLEKVLNGKRRNGVVVTLNNNTTYTNYIQNTRDALANTDLDALYTSSFTVSTKQLDTYNIAHQPANYIFGIPNAALRNNSRLQQSSTWGGTFDPLQ